MYGCDQKRSFDQPLKTELKDQDKNNILKVELKNLSKNLAQKWG